MLPFTADPVRKNSMYLRWFCLQRIPIVLQIQIRLTISPIGEYAWVRLSRHAGRHPELGELWLGQQGNRDSLVIGRTSVSQGNKTQVSKYQNVNTS